MNETSRAPVVRVTHRFRAAPERVFDAWLDPALASRWLFMSPGSVPVRCELDARVGGAWTIVVRREEEETLHTGEYLEIDRPRRLVFTFSVPQYAPHVDRVEIDIVPTDDGGCELTLKDTMVPEAAEWAEPAAEGWTMILEGLETALDPGVEMLDAESEVGLARETATTRALARGASAKQEMIQAAGGCLSSGEVARLLEKPVSEVNQHRARNQILAVPLPGAEWGFPAVQFSDGDLRGGVAEVVSAAGAMSPWVLLSILLDRVAGSETRIIESLDDPEVKKDVLSRVCSYGQHSAS